MDASVPARRVLRVPALPDSFVLLARRFWVPATLAAILVLAAVVRLYDIVGNPPGFFADEASEGYNAYSVLHTGRDEHGKVLPLFFEAFGENKLPVYTYSQVPFIAVLGLSELPVRLTAAFYGVLTVLAVYLLVQELFRNRALALVSAATLAILPWHIFYSRTGLGEIIVYPFFLVLSLYLFVLGLRRPGFWLLAAVAFGLTLLSYRAAWVTLPPLLLLLAVLYRRELMRRWRFALPMLIVLGLVSAAILAQVLGASSDRAREQSILQLDLGVWGTVKRVLAQYWEHFQRSLLFDGTAEQNRRHVVPGSGWLYWWQVPFLVLGTLALLWKPSRAKLLVLALLALFPAGAAVTRDSPSSSRAILGAVAFSLVTAYGIVAAFSLVVRWRWPGRSPRVRKTLRASLVGALAVGTTVAASLAFASFLGSYQGEYKDKAVGFDGWQWGAGPVIERFVAVEDQYDYLILDGDPFNAGDIFPRFYAPDACSGCSIGRLDSYTPQWRQLFAFPPHDLYYNYDFDVKDAVFFPNGETAFVITEVTGVRDSLPGNLPSVTPESGTRSLEVLHQAIAGGEHLPADLVERAALYLSMSEFDLAINDYDIAIDIDPNNTEALVGRALAFWRQGQVHSALSDYAAALEIDPGYVPTLYNRANAYAAMRWYEEAIKDYSAALELDPNLAEAHNNLANTYIAREQPDLALDHLYDAIELQPDLAVAYANRGIASAQEGFPAGALDDLEQAIRLDPGLAFAHAALGDLHLSQGELDLAVAAYAQAIELDPAYAEAYTSRGAAYAELGQYDLALLDLDQALQLDRDSAPAYFARGLALVATGEYQKAIPDLKQAVDLDRLYQNVSYERKNPLWAIGDVGPGLAGIERAASAVSDPALASELARVITYLSSR
ncbi:MAG: tetratricopeptide repeat protein [Dehalococcoidia bacterium]|nr:tetratricopeptide repeat protein [Dehalococcoidia bacterium]